MSAGEKKSPLLETQIPKMPAVVRLELPTALELLRGVELLLSVVKVYSSGFGLTRAQRDALAKFEQRIREAESRTPRAVGIFAEVLAACTCPLGLPPLEDCPVHGGGAS